MNRADFKVEIVQNSYDDILFYEKKALSLDKMQTKLNENMFRIDMQMNLGEFLHKIKNANI